MNILPPPGPQRRRQLILLAICLVAAIVVGVRYWEPGPPAAAPAATSNAQQGRTAGAPPPGATQLPEALKLAALEPVPDEPAAGRNPFRFGVRPPPPAPPAPPRVETPPPPPPTPPGPPPIRLELQGLTTLPDGRTMAVLRDPATSALLRAFEGQIIDGRYRLVKVGLQSVVVAYLDGTGQRTLPIR